MVKSIFVITICFLLSACVFQHAGETMSLHAKSVSYLNPDIRDQASPVVVTIYQLKSPVLFQRASYSALTMNDNQVLGDDLLDKMYFEIQPSATKSIIIHLLPNTRYLGFVADYRHTKQANDWHTISKVSPGGTILLSLESQTINAKLLHKKTNGGFHE